MHDAELQGHSELRERIQSLSVVDLFSSLASQTSRKRKAETDGRGGESCREGDCLGHVDCATDRTLKSVGEEVKEERVKTNRTSEAPRFPSASAPPVPHAVEGDISRFFSQVFANGSFPVFPPWEAGDDRLFKTAKILDESFEHETGGGAEEDAQETQTCFETAAAGSERDQPPCRDGDVARRVLGKAETLTSAPASEETPEGRAETARGRRGRSHAVRQASFLFEDEQGDPRREGERRTAGGGAIYGGRVGEEKATTPLQAQGSVHPPLSVGRQRSRIMVHASSSSSSSSSSSVAASSVSSGAAHTSSSSCASCAFPPDPSELSPLDLLRLGRPQREFAAADQVLRLQALSSKTVGRTADDGPSAQRAFLWRRATLRLTPEVTAALSPAALRQTMQALSAGRAAGMLPPSPMLLVQVLNACTEKLIYWTLADQLLVLNTVSALLLPPLPSDASSPLSPRVSVLPGDCLSRGASPTGPSPARDWGGGALGSAAAVTLEMLLQRLQAVRESLSVSDVASILHVYSRVGLLSPKASVAFLDALYRNLLANQARQQRLVRLRPNGEREGGSSSAGRDKVTESEEKLHRGQAALGYAQGREAGTRAAEKQSGWAMGGPADTPRGRSAPLKDQAPAAASWSSSSSSLSESFAALLRLADSVASLLEQQTDRGLPPADAMLGEQLWRRHLHRMQQRQPTTSGRLPSGDRLQAPPPAALQEERSEVRRATGRAAPEDGREREKTDTGEISEGEPGRHGRAEGDGEGMQQEQFVSAEVTRESERQSEELAKALSPVSCDERASQAARHRGAVCQPFRSSADSHSAFEAPANAALSPLSLRLMARLLQHLAEAFLSGYSCEREQREAPCMHASSQNSETDGSAVRGCGTTDSKGVPASLHALHVTRLLHAMTLLDFHAFSMYSRTQVLRSRRLFEQLFAMLRVDDLLCLEGIDGGMGASAAVAIVSSLAVQKRLFERSERVGLSSEKGEARQGAGAGRVAAAPTLSAEAEDREKAGKQGDARGVAKGSPTRTVTGDTAATEKRQAAERSQCAKSEEESRRTGVGKGGFFFDALKDDVLPRLVTVAVRHAHTLSVHQHAVLLEALSLHLGFRHDFLLDALRCSALAAARGALGVSSVPPLRRTGDDRAHLSSLFAPAWSTVRVFCTLLRQHPLTAFPVILEGHGVFTAATDVLAAFCSSLSPSSGPARGRTIPALFGLLSPDEKTEEAQLRLLSLLLVSLLPHLRKEPQVAALPSGGACANALASPVSRALCVEQGVQQRGTGTGFQERQREPRDCRREKNGFRDSSERRTCTGEGETAAEDRRLTAGPVVSRPGLSGASPPPGRMSSPRLRPLWVYLHPNLTDFDKPPLCFLEGPVRQQRTSLPELLNKMAVEAERLLKTVTAATRRKA
uniref:Uncharacterized protein n=1 Tax=Neospora caninum (strain Liverpool) TaxID=572307 RepID=A0A0F7UD73_NEOCL|nr:TPA: hypothetical protein BN1204_036190 [Neospora caninum Liverpool]